GALRDQDPCRTHQWIDDIAHPEGKLLHLPTHARTNNRFVQFDLCLGQRRFGAGFFGREEGRDPVVSGLLRWRRGDECADFALCTALKPLDLAEGNVARIASVQLLLGLQFVHGLLASALGLFELTFSLCDIRSSHGHLRVDLYNLATRSLYSSLLLCTVH